MRQIPMIWAKTAVVPFPEKGAGAGGPDYKVVLMWSTIP